LNARPPQSNADIDFRQPEHPVTPPMAEAAAREARKVAPAFTATAVEGQSVRVGADMVPTFLYFVKDGCPCSYDAEPLFQKLSKHVGEAVQFVSVTDGDAKQAQKWNDGLVVPYPLVSDPKGAIIQKYGVERGVYAVLIRPDGTIDTMWPGYSKRLLGEMNAAIWRMAGKPARPFDPLYAPVEDASGCEYDFSAN
jgi:peroxiredoxin